MRSITVDPSPIVSDIVSEVDTAFQDNQQMRHRILVILVQLKCELLDAVLN